MQTPLGSFLLRHSILALSCLLIFACQSTSDSPQPTQLPTTNTTESDSPNSANWQFLPSGKANMMFSGWQGPDLKIWTYRPADSTPNTPIVFIMHGTNRDGDRYRDEWVDLAEKEKFIVVAPEFPRAEFPGAIGYNLGYILTDEGGEPRPKDQWAFSAIEPIFDEVRRLTRTKNKTYAMYGHSAGAQFVHRFVFFVPEARLTRAVAANAGWYTLPTFDQDYPYGLSGTGLAPDTLNAALGSKLVVLLGTADNDPNHRSLRRTPEANAQGPHRFARGHTFFDTGKKRATQESVPFSWKIQYAPGIGHKNGLMANFAAGYLAQPVDSPKSLSQ